MVRRGATAADAAAFLEAGQYCACFNLRKAARAVSSLYDDALRPVGLRATQFALLTITSALGSVTVTQLAEHAVMDRTTLTRNLGPLEKRGLVRVCEGTDRRVREVRLTPRGREVWSKGIPLWHQAQNRIAEGLGEKRLRSLVADLGAAVAVVRGARRA
jgi:DNA-binding MarR family transcriptional regulator